MPHVYAAAASPLGQAAMELASEGPRTKGGKAVFAVVLMFTILCGGVFMLLQSSFGVKVGYLITGTAFWGCWLVLSLLWLAGVPGLALPGGIPDIPRSSAQYTGPQGTDASWELLDTEEERAQYAVADENLVAIDVNSPIDQNLVAEVTAATTAAGEGIAAYYAREASVAESAIMPNSVYVIDRTAVSRRGGRVEFVRLSTRPAQPNESTTPETRALIEKIEPATFDLYYVEGNLALPTYGSIALFSVLFALHLGLLGYVDSRGQAVPEGAQERLVTV